MTQGFFRDLRYSGLPTAWSLTIEESFYAVAPHYTSLLARSPSGDMPIFVLSTATTARFVLALSRRSGRPFRMFRRTKWYFVQAFGWKFGGFMGDITHVLHATLGGRFAECSYAIAILTGVLILALSQEEARVSRLLSNGLLVYLGRISYGFYLIQLTVIMDPMLRFTDSLGPWRLPALCILMNLSLCGAV
ncbi:MAG: hypothetical protein IPO18_03815 [bacterium]|nr:hypothetical protein [bacterium]